MSEYKVLYIGGCSRSGSTLLERMLGQLDGFHAAGEIWHIWKRSFMENQLCGCNRPFRECGFWSQVVEEAFGGFHNVNPGELQALKQSVLSARHIPLIVFPFLQSAQYKEQLREYAAVMQKLYRAISRVSGSRVVIDSSKFPHYAAVLDAIPGVDLRVVHLVRDSRATAYSWQRKRVRPEVHWTVSYMDGHGPLGSAVEWSAMNYLLQTLRRGGDDYMILRYEDFVRSPRGSLLRILAHAGEAAVSLDFFQGEYAVHLQPNHTVSGNPNRFQQGEVRISPDGEWQEKMAKGQKFAVTALTWPLLIQYGYLRIPPTGRVANEF